jgi:serralysin
LNGNDILIGGAGRDALVGGNGLDFVLYTTAKTGILADLAAPRFNKGDAAGDTYSSIERLGGSGYADSLRGNDASNVIRGYGGNDLLYGRDGNDVLYGDAGNDRLFAQGGCDTLVGGAGSDLFIFTSPTMSRGSGIDRIADFVRGADHIYLRGIDANTKVSGDQAFSFIGKYGFTGKPGQLNFANGLLSGDLNGDRIADFQVKIAGLSALAKGDFYL